MVVMNLMLQLVESDQDVCYMEVTEDGLEAAHNVICCLLVLLLDYVVLVGWISPLVTAYVFSQLIVELDSHSAAHVHNQKVEKWHSAAHMLVFDCSAIESD